MASGMVKSSRIEDGGLMRYMVVAQSACSKRTPFAAKVSGKDRKQNE